MYHARFKKSHYEAGFHWGRMLFHRGMLIRDQHTFVITAARKEFANQCYPLYQQYYPEILSEIRGIADGQQMAYEDLYTFLFSMYCFELEHHCTCMASKDADHIIFGRNSDFLVELERRNMNCLYDLDHAFAFNGNTTAFVQMEDGVNEYGLAIGLTFICPVVIEAGLNAGMLVRYLLEKCKTTKEVIGCLKRLPIASQQTLTIADASGDIAVVECNSKHIEVISPAADGGFVTATNTFHSEKMKSFNNDHIDDWRAEERYSVAYNSLKNNRHHISVPLIKDILSGEYGFMCQYDRKSGADTVWSVIYDIKNHNIYRAEGNPGRKAYQKDERMKWLKSYN